MPPLLFSLLSIKCYILRYIETVAYPDQNIISIIFQWTNSTTVSSNKIFFTFINYRNVNCAVYYIRTKSLSDWIKFHRSIYILIGSRFIQQRINLQRSRNSGRGLSYFFTRPLAKIKGKWNRRAFDVTRELHQRRFIPLVLRRRDTPSR